MFYVIYLIKPKKYAVIPIHWIQGHRTQLPKFINYGLNTTQKVLAFYSPSTMERIRNGARALDFLPDFQASLTVEYPAEGCYLAKPIKYFGKFRFLLILCCSILFGIFKIF